MMNKLQLTTLILLSTTVAIAPQGAVALSSSTTLHQKPSTTIKDRPLLRKFGNSISKRVINSKEGYNRFGLDDHYTSAETIPCLDLQTTAASAAAAASSSNEYDSDMSSRRDIRIATLLMITRNNNMVMQQQHHHQRQLHNKNMVYTVAPLDQDAASFDFRVKTPHLFVALSTLLIASSRVLTKTTLLLLLLPLLLPLPNQNGQHAN
jgi:hypothetical protein